MAGTWRQALAQAKLAAARSSETPHVTGMSLTRTLPRAYFRFHAPQFPARLTKMLMQPNSSYRYYGYYGSLSARRDGAAMNCRRVLVM
jgi:hypothetical protein